MADYFAAYIRHRGRFSRGPVSYTLETVYNLPEFDTLGRDTALLMDLICKRFESNYFAASGPQTIVWNPGQGHAPLFLTGYFSNLHPEKIAVASRDVLQLEISVRNLAASRDGEEAPEVKSYHVPSMDALREEIAPGSVSLALLMLNPVSGTGWQDEAARLVDRAVAPGGIVAACAGSTTIHRLLEALHGMVLHGSRKYHGSRAVLLKKQV